jgi:chloramphenicol-sensitive protein RarD
LITTGLIAINWFTFIWAVGHDRVLQASLGYYINPLVNVALGFVFLKERPRRAQWIAVALATVAVATLTWQMGRLPIIALVLAFSFGIYGLLRKTMRAEALVGLAVETTLLLPVAAGYLIWLARNGAMHFGRVTFTDDVLLVAAGVVTALPLLWFANAARRLKYTTVGLLQYIAPSLQFLTAVLVFGEALRLGQILAFALIWVALAVYTQDAWRQPR